MDGFEVLTATEGIKKADFVVTSTGCKGVVGEKELRNAKDGCILANSGHFNNEIDIQRLEEMAVSSKKVREDVMEYEMKDGRKLYLLSEGRLVNLAAGQGHPAEIMDMSFALQMLAAKHVVMNDLENAVHDIPREIDEKVARLRLRSDGIDIDTLTEEQKDYLEGWEEGT